MTHKNLYIHTFGCQMNAYDSERIAKSLKEMGYHRTHSWKRANLVIINTCAIREKAEQKVFSLLGRFAQIKQYKPDLIIGVGGCVAQQEGKKILSRIPEVDFVFGTHTLHRLPEIISRIETIRSESEVCNQGKKRIVDIEFSDKTDYLEFATAPYHKKNVTSFVTIMQGCDNFCAYCVVPYVRGREISRRPENIIDEIKELVSYGIREITLLGQNVNSYGQKEGLCSFSELLSMINEIKGLLRIRFTTSHPKDLSEELMKAFNQLDKLCKHIHLPVQSGSNTILKQMNRKYSRELYLEKIEKLRHICPDIAISSDFIVGFPGETAADFEATLNLIKTVEYDSLFAFKYSDRTNAPAARFSDKISEEEKKERINKLLSLQEDYTIKKNRSMVGKREWVLVEGISKRQKTGVRSQESESSSQLPATSQHPTPNTQQWTGRTSTNKVVNFIKNDDSDDEDLTGKMVRVEIKKAFPHSLWGCKNKSTVSSTGSEACGEDVMPE